MESYFYYDTSIFDIRYLMVVFDSNEIATNLPNYKFAYSTVYGAASYSISYVTPFSYNNLLSTFVFGLSSVVFFNNQ